MSLAVSCRNETGEVIPTPVSPTSTPTQTPTMIPTSTPSPMPATVTPEPVVAAAIGGVHELIPWYVPGEYHEAYTACLEHPDRFNRTDWILSKDWPRADAEYVADHEGGWDLCQFNTQGSGACGWFQILPCPSDGLTPQGQISAAYNKWLDGGGSFERHWFRFWK